MHWRRRSLPLSLLRTIAFWLAVRLPALRPHYLEMTIERLRDDEPEEAFAKLLSGPLEQVKVGVYVVGVGDRVGPCWWVTLLFAVGSGKRAGAEEVPAYTCTCCLKWIAANICQSRPHHHPPPASAGLRLAIGGCRTPWLRFNGRSSSSWTRWTRPRMQRAACPSRPWRATSRGYTR